MTAYDSKSYLSYLNKLVDQYNNTFHHSINKNLLMLIILLWLKKMIPILKFKVNDTVRITKYKNICSISKCYTVIGQEKNLLSILFGKLILGHTKLKI